MSVQEPKHSRRRARQTARWRFGLLALPVLSLGVLLVATSCDRNPFYKDADSESETTEHNIPYSAAAAKPVDVSRVGEAPTEENALKSYFKGKKFLSMAYFAKDDAKAKQYGAEAERCFEKSLKFYVPDIRAMVAGKKPVHPSANWEFLKSLHESWSVSIGLCGKRLAAKEYIDGNAKDAWALSVISRMAPGEENEEKRRKLIDEKFAEIREGLGGGDKYAERLAAMQSAAEKKQPQTVRTVAMAGSEPGLAAKSPTATPVVTSLVKTNVAAAKTKLEDGLVAEDPLTGKAAFSIKTALGTPPPVAATAVVRTTKRDDTKVALAAATTSGIEKKAVAPPAVVESKDNASAPKPTPEQCPARAEFKPWLSSPGKLYIGDRIYTLPAAPGKLYIGDRVYTLPAQEKPRPPAGQ
ncbi:MAG: hypothetical protein NTY01_05065 [Verrucomicrobia bacterium]|nr:hypothetical protein [Verrucomicrobiota bacterium]